MPRGITLPCGGGPNGFLGDMSTARSRAGLPSQAVLTTGSGPALPHQAAEAQGTEAAWGAAAARPAPRREGRAAPLGPPGRYLVVPGAGGEDVGGLERGGGQGTPARPADLLRHELGAHVLHGRARPAPAPARPAPRALIGCGATASAEGQPGARRGRARDGAGRAGSGAEAAAVPPAVGAGRLQLPPATGTGRDWPCLAPASRCTGAYWLGVGCRSERRKQRKK